jgi:cytochrome c biogenesis protein CcmG, thiol:disulfide interchange protein DsbE
MTEPIPTDEGVADEIARVVPINGDTPTTSSSKPAGGGRGKIVVIAVAAVLGALGFSVLTSKKSTPKASTKTPASTVAVSSASTAPDATVETAPGLQTPPAETQLVKLTGAGLPNLTEGADTAVGTPAPSVEGFGLDGKPIKIDAADGKAKVIFFIAHWCPHCQREVPLIAKWQQEGKLPTNLAYYTVSTAVQPKGANFPPSAWLQKEKWPFPVLADDKDSTVVKSFGFSGFPFFVVVRADGTVGARDSGEKELEELLAILAKAN